MTDLAELLADCDARGIRLLPAGEGRLTTDAPQDALTPDLTGRLQEQGRAAGDPAGHWRHWGRTGG